MSQEQIIAGALNVETFERVVYSRQYEAAALELFTVIRKIKTGSAIITYKPSNPTLETVFSRLASAIAALFADPQFTLTPEGYFRMVCDHATIHAVFRASVYRSADHVLGVIGRQADNPESLSFTDNNVLKLLVLWGLESEIAIDFEALSKQMPQIVQAALLGMIAVGGVHTEKAYATKVRLIRKLALLEAAPLPEAMMIAVGDCYMHCSYLDIADRHAIKPVLNRLLRGLVTGALKTQGLQHIERRTFRTDRERPVVVVPIEWFGSSHAMYRCYAMSVRQLRTKFRVVAISPSGQIDEVGRAEFDHVRLVDGNNIQLGTLLAEIAAEDPDIIWYPSIGMSAWWVALSTLRLAPLQIMSPGHPASSHSPEIDAIISDGDLFGDESRYSERCISMPVGGARYIGRTGIDYSRIQKPGDGVLRVAVAAMVMKLTPPFLRTVERIWIEAKGKVEFHFFPNMQASGHYFIERALKEWIPDCVVHQRAEYQQYIEQLGRCDFMLGTFPFGGTNSVIDAFLCGVPVLCLEGDEILERSDASMVKRLRCGKIAITSEDYERIALKMIAGEELDISPREAVEREFFGTDGPQNAFVDAVWNLYMEKYREQNGTVGGVGDGVGITAAFGRNEARPVGLGSLDRRASDD